VKKAIYSITTLFFIFLSTAVYSAYIVDERSYTNNKIVMYEGKCSNNLEFVSCAHNAKYNWSCLGPNGKGIGATKQQALDYACGD